MGSLYQKGGPYIRRGGSCTLLFDNIVGLICGVTASLRVLVLRIGIGVGRKAMVPQDFLHEALLSAVSNSTLVPSSNIATQP